MMISESTKIARPYAKAAFLTAKEAGDLDLWVAALSNLSFIVKQTEVLALILSPRVTPADKALFLVDVLKEHLTESLEKFVSLLAANRRLSLLPRICELFMLILAEETKTISVEIVTAVPLEVEMVSLYADNLKKRLDKNVTVSTRIDKTLMGGAIVKAGDWVIDGSLRSQLRRMAEALVV